MTDENDGTARHKSEAVPRTLYRHPYLTTNYTRHSETRVEIIVARQLHPHTSLIIDQNFDCLSHELLLSTIQVVTYTKQYLQTPHPLCFIA